MWSCTTCESGAKAPVSIGGAGRFFKLFWPMSTMSGRRRGLRSGIEGQDTCILVFVIAFGGVGDGANG